MAKITISIDYNKCKGDGECITNCPHHVYDRDETGRTIVAHPERCGKCFTCSKLCMHDAIIIKEEGVMDIDLD